MFRVVLRFSQMKARDMKEPRKKLTQEQKKERLAEMKRYMSGARAVTEQMTMQEIKEAEARVEAFMATQFTEYVPLKHHLFNFQARNVRKQHSKLTPQDELSKFNLYVGGEGQTEEKMSKYEERKASSVAREVRDVEEVDGVQGDWC